jgi:hypothetical protein
VQLPGLRRLGAGEGPDALVTSEMAIDPNARKHAARRELVAVMRLVLEDIAARKAAEQAERRGRLTVVDGRRRDAA